jgi:hypothetical protein
MRFNRFVLVGLFSIFATATFAQNVPLPDYSNWTKTADHSSSYLSGDKEIQVRDVHYQYVNPEQTEGSLVIVFYTPSTAKTWFAVYVHQHANPQKPNEAYLYDSDENGNWVFVQDLPDPDAIVSVIESRYHLVQIQR